MAPLTALHAIDDQTAEVPGPFVKPFRGVDCKSIGFGHHYLRSARGFLIRGFLAVVEIVLVIEFLK